MPIAAEASVPDRHRRWRAACGACFVVVLALICVAFGHRVVEWVAPQDINMTAAIGAFAFGVAFAAVAAWCKWIQKVVFASIVLGLLRAFSVWVLCLALVFSWTVFSRSSFSVLGVFLPALLEELVFRLGVESRLRIVFAPLMSSMRLQRLAATLIASAVFVTSHYLTSISRLYVEPTELLRLGTLGVLYSAIVWYSDIWFAAGAHAILNSIVLANAMRVGHRPGGVELTTIMILALGLITMPRTRPDREQIQR